MSAYRGRWSRVPVDSVGKDVLTVDRSYLPDRFGQHRLGADLVDRSEPESEFSAGLLCDRLEILQTLLRCGHRQHAHLRGAVTLGEKTALSVMDIGDNALGPRAA